MDAAPFWRPWLSWLVAVETYLEGMAPPSEFPTDEAGFDLQTRLSEEVLELREQGELDGRTVNGFTVASCDWLAALEALAAGSRGMERY